MVILNFVKTWLFTSCICISVPSNLCPSSELPPGLILLEDFISQEYSQELLKCLDFGDQQGQYT